MSVNELTTIAVSRQNHQRLVKLGRKGQSFDDILSDLLKEKEPLQNNNQATNSEVIL